ncbi:MAG: leucine-rich repeat domain-containing protein [Muribaculaceae bacterium]
MKNFLQKICLTSIVLCFSVVGFAHDFEVDGIYYNKNSDGVSVSVTYYGSSSFENYDEYCGHVIIPIQVTFGAKKYTVTSISDHAFAWCSNLTSIEIPNSITSICENAFDACWGLTSITIPNSVTFIGNGAFSNCSSLKTVQFNAENCANLYNATWTGCENITSFTIGENVKKIPANLCYRLSQLTSIEIPNSVTSIGGYAFWDCNSLTSVTIPNSVTSIGNSAFGSCGGLTSIQCDAITPPSLGDAVFYGVDKRACSLIVPEESLEAYKAADQWKDFLNIGGVEEIAIEDSNISVENGMITNRNNEIIEIYNLSGAKVYTGYDAEVSLKGGMYIVKVGGKVVKIVI